MIKKKSDDTLVFDHDVFYDACEKTNVNNFVYNMVTSVCKGKTPKVKVTNAKELPYELLKFISERVAPNSPLHKRLTALVSKFEYTPEMFERRIDDLCDMRIVLEAMTHEREKTVLGFKIHGKMYPVYVDEVELNHTFFGDVLTVSWCYYVCDYKTHVNLMIRPDNLSNESMQRRTVREVLESIDLYQIGPEDVNKMKLDTKRVIEYSKMSGTFIDVKGNVYINNQSFWVSSLQAIDLTAYGKAGQAIIETYAESSFQGNGDLRNSLPFIRAFSLDLKQYVYIHVDDFTAHTYDDHALDTLVMPEDVKSVLNAVFRSTNDSSSRGGMVILTNGPPGVGKTLTAEVFAECTHRPLYVLEMGELGTALTDVEQTLQRIFYRATRWNAVLLFDEADIFMAKRTEADLERSAIVGVFLRLLDKYTGTMFLTTNRADVIDHAFHSRVTLTLHYSELTIDHRKMIWSNMLTAAGFTVDNSVLESVAHLFDVNGRQIRNQVRLLKTLYAGETLSFNMFERTMQYVSRSS